MTFTIHIPNWRHGMAFWIYLGLVAISAILYGCYLSYSAGLAVGVKPSDGWDLLGACSFVGVAWGAGNAIVHFMIYQRVAKESTS